MKFFILAIVLILGWSLPTSSQSDAVRPMVEPAIENSSPGEETSSGEIRMRRHRVNLTVSSLDDVKVREGDQVNAGDLLSDRTEQRLALESQKEALNRAIEQSQRLLPPLAPLPEPDFSRQEIAIVKARAEIQILEETQLPVTRFRPENPQLHEVADFGALQAAADLRERKIQANIALQMAIAELAAAKGDYQQKLYEHSIQQQRFQQSQQQQQYQIGLLVRQAAEIEDKLDRLAVVRSPVNGRIRRVKTTGQSDRTISVEVTIDPSKSNEEFTEDN